MSFYDIYYEQYGGGGRGINNVYIGSPRQKGHGLGSFFTGLFRRALPYLAKGARAIGKEALKTGVNILEDISEKNMNLKEAFKNRVNESGQNLKRKAAEKLTQMMQGSGYKPLLRKRRTQSHSKRGRQRTHKKRSKPVKRLQTKKRKSKTKVVRKQNKRSKSVKRRKSVKTSDIFN